MPPMKPTLTPAVDGAPLTAGRWNALAGSVEALYDAFGQLGRESVEIDVTWRGEPVPGARVLGIPVGTDGKPSGPAIEAVAPIGDLTAHALVGVTPGRWKIDVEAVGYDPATAWADAVPTAGAGPLATVQVELTRRTVPAPDLVGLWGPAAENLLRWARLPATFPDLIGTVPPGENPGYGETSSVILQGYQGSQIDPGSAVDWFYSRSPGRPPWRAVVPDLLGWPQSGQDVLDGPFKLRLGQQVVDPLATGPARIVWQSPAAGEVVASGTAVDVRYGAGDAAATYGPYTGTHRKLADRRIADVAQALAQAELPAHEPAFGFRYSVYWAPWRIVRTYISDADLKVIVDFFASVGAPVTAAPDEGLAALWASLLVTVG